MTTFEGSFDAKSQTLTIAYGQPKAEGEAQSAVSLTYGVGANKVYFHTIPGSVMLLT